MQSIEEERSPGDVPAFHNPAWRRAFPWLIQGITGRGDDDRPFDLGFFGARGGGADVWARWSRLAQVTGIRRIAHGPQIHGNRVRFHRSGPPGILLCPEGDGHLTADAGILLAVTVADCVPVFLVDPDRPAVALIHAGWRGVAAGILERGVAALEDRLGSTAERLHLHAGPAICGACYEVGPEVHEALGRTRPADPTPIDLRAILSERALVRGVRPERITVSSRCTLCGDSPFFSHRGGDEERQVAFLGVAHQS